MPIFETPRLQLRPLGDADEALYGRLYTDPEVMRHIAAPLTAGAARVAFQHVTRLMQQVQPTMQFWVLRERASCSDIGILALIRHADLPEAREMGVMLLVQGHGRGFAVEAQTALLDWVFSAPGVGMVWSRNAPGNAAAAGVRLKLSFARTPDGQGDSGAMRWQMTRTRWNGERPGAGMEKRDGCR